MHDENAHRKRQQAKGRQVQMEAVGQPRDIGATLGGLQGQVGRDLGQGRQVAGLVRPHQQAVDPACAVQQPLRRADIGHGGVIGQIGGDQHRDPVQP